MTPENESLALSQEKFIVSNWLLEQGADAARHVLLKFLDFDDGITYVLAVSTEAALYMQDDEYMITVETAKSLWPFLYVKPERSEPLLREITS